MATPNLNSELFKLRIRIGDTYTSAGEKFVISPTSNLDKDGSAITSNELVDIYNCAIREFIKIMVNVISKDRWAYLLPGYVVLLPSVSPESDLSGNEISADFIKLSNILINESIKEVIQLKANSGTPLSNLPGHSIGIYYPPNIFNEVIVGNNEIIKKQTMYTIMNTLVKNEYVNCIVITPKSTNPSSTKYCLTILKEHTNFVLNSLKDLSYNDIPYNTCDMILAFAEKEYYNRRQFDNYENIDKKITDIINIIRRK